MSIVQLDPGRRRSERHYAHGEDFPWTRESTLAIRAALHGKSPPYAAETIFEMLQIAQQQLGTESVDSVPLKGIEAIAHQLALPTIDVYDVALLHKPAAPTAPALVSDEAASVRDSHGKRAGGRRRHVKSSPRATVGASPRPPSAGQRPEIDASPRRRPVSARSSCGSEACQSSSAARPNSARPSSARPGSARSMLSARASGRLAGGVLLLSPRPSCHCHPASRSLPRLPLLTAVTELTTKSSSALTPLPPQQSKRAH